MSDQETMRADELLTPKELAAEYKVGLSTVYGWKHRGVGPRCLKVGGVLRYRRSDVDAWIAAATEAEQ